MVQLTTAGRLLDALNSMSPAARDAVALAAGLSPERADAAMIGALRLSLSEQLRLSEATVVLAPKFARHALRLRGQVLAARSYEATHTGRLCSSTMRMSHTCVVRPM